MNIAKSSFEIAVRNAFKQISIDVQISFCYFHFCQSLLRHVQNQGKKNHFKDSHKDAELKVEKINAGEDIWCKKRKLEHIHERVEALVLNNDTGKTDILNFLSGMAHNVAI